MVKAFKIDTENQLNLLRLINIITFHPFLFKEVYINGKWYDIKDEELLSIALDYLINNKQWQTHTCHKQK